MPRLFRAAGLLLALCLVASGCGSHTNKPIVTYERDSPTIPAMSVVSEKGLYALFPGDDVKQPLLDAYLHPGDKFGFQSQEGKTVGAYVKAGEIKTVTLDDILAGEYVWKFQGDKQP
ncbi:MAG TPA: hypothetical protein VFE47_13785 [Tepidisphaeraceae bacterium]|jgi:hypothetical protein|nr:hypothetical protein [Tepidisphaeraceae bacterium]